MEAVTRPRNNSWIDGDRSSRAPAEPALEFGRFRTEVGRGYRFTA
jgi:hypothetical protein